MSNITLQFGQCGNQIGQALYDCIHEDISRKSDCNKGHNKQYIYDVKHSWFNLHRDELHVRSLLIDTEEKVTQTVSRNRPYKVKNVISGSYGGSANNWAFGYTSRSSLLVKEVMEKLRREVEKCDTVGSLLNILSGSGGTGSGVGSRIVQLIKEEYPSKFITNVIILPFQKGDVVTQNYNVVLTLAKLYNVADNTILFENDKIFDIVRKLAPNKEISFFDLNRIISKQLASVLLPIEKDSFPHLVSRLSCHPSYRFIQLKTAPHWNIENVRYESTPQWSNLTNQVIKSSKCDLVGNKTKIKYVGNLLLRRGTKESDFDIRGLQEAAYPQWVPKSESVICRNQRRQFLDYQRFISLMTNNNNICNALDFIVGDAWNLFTHGAYVHHYRKYGVDDEYFLGAFQKMENVLNDYKTL